LSGGLGSVQHVNLKNMPRTGRHKQRYDESGARLVAGCVPIQLAEGAETLEGAIRVLLIESVNRGDWILPKGGWEKDETVEEAAVRETQEEAGVQGDVLCELQTLEIVSKKGNVSRARFFLLLVSKELEMEENRQRKWVTYSEGCDLLRDNFQALVKDLTSNEVLQQFWNKAAVQK
jgi:diphosphoinositol-polyphosphate diphosphatase